MDDFTLILIAVYSALGALVIVLWSVRHYELAVLLMAISPWVTPIFIPNTDDMEAATEAGIGSYIRVCMLLLVGAIGAIRFLKAGPRRTVPFQMVLLGLFVLIAVVSTAYSIDPRYTFIRAASAAAFFAFLLGLECWLDSAERLRRLMETLFMTVLLGAGVSVVSALVLPDKAWAYPDMTRFQGLFGHPNVMGGFCMLSYPLLFWKYRRSAAFGKWVVLSVGGVLSFLHLLTGSRGSLLPAAILICVWFAALRQWTRLVCFAGGFVVLALCALTLMPSKFERPDNAGLTGLTSRQEFWLGALELVRERPVTGYGFAVEGKVWEDPRFNQAGYYLWSGSARTSLHNGYLSVAIGGGFVALAIWCALLFIPFMRCIVTPGDDYRAFAISVIFASLVRNFLETEIAPTGSGIVFWAAWLIAGHDVLGQIGNRTMRSVGWGKPLVNQ